MMSQFDMVTSSRWGDLYTTTDTLFDRFVMTAYVVDVLLLD
jgi:hypothetical protein